MALSLADFLAMRPVNQQAVDAWKAVMLAEQAAHTASVSQK